MVFPANATLLSEHLDPNAIKLLMQFLGWKKKVTISNQTDAFILIYTLC